MQIISTTACTLCACFLARSLSPSLSGIVILSLTQECTKNKHRSTHSHDSITSLSFLLASAVSYLSNKLEKRFERFPEALNWRMWGVTRNGIRTTIEKLTRESIMLIIAFSWPMQIVVFKWLLINIENWFLTLIILTWPLQNISLFYLQKLLGCFCCMFWVIVHLYYEAPHNQLCSIWLNLDRKYIPIHFRILPAASVFCHVITCSCHHTAPPCFTDDV